MVATRETRLNKFTISPDDRHPRPCPAIDMREWRSRSRKSGLNIVVLSAASRRRTRLGANRKKQVKAAAVAVGARLEWHTRQVTDVKKRSFVCMPITRSKNVNLDTGSEDQEFLRIFHLRDDCDTLTIGHIWIWGNFSAQRKLPDLMIEFFNWDMR
jgi:hypothetical protein